MLRVALVVLVQFAIGAAGFAADDPRAWDFEADEIGKSPSGWFVPTPGWRATATRDAERASRCVLVARAGGGGGQAPAFGNLMQSLDATPFRGKRIILEAAVRARGAAAGEPGRAQMWLRVDRPNEQMGFFDNMGDRPITKATWEQYRIVADIDADAQQIAVGLMVFVGKAWIDDVSLRVVGEARDDNEPARPLTERGLENLTALARLYGYVRYFHPSDEAAAADWERLLRAGVKAVEGAADAEALAGELRMLFEPIAPSVAIQAEPFGAAEAAAPQDGAVGYTAWRHFGMDVADAHQVYSSERMTWDLDDAAPEHTPSAGATKTAQLAPGVWARVPLVLARDDAGTLPHPLISRLDPPEDEFFRPSGDDRTTRLVGTIIAWNVFQHFYAYFDVVEIDWNAVLADSLKEAAEDADAADFHETLEKLVAKLKDGHGFVGSTNSGGWHTVPLAWAFVGPRLVVTNPGALEDVISAGDEVLEIDGEGVSMLAERAGARVSAATEQHRRFRVAHELARGGASMARLLKLRKPDGTEYTHTVTCVEPNQRPFERRPAMITEVRPGVWYVDIDRVTDDDIRANMDDLAAAKGLVFDLRGYPGRLSTIVLAHLADKQVRSAHWCIPILSRPDREGIEYTNGGWPVPPMQPRWTSNAAFVIDGRAISYAETYMGIVEAFKLADIVGEATAGTNGNVNSFRLPGGYAIGFTGMKVRKHDGSEHHCTGVVPTHPVQRTVEGIAAGRDELLDAALDLVEGRIKKE